MSTKQVIVARRDLNMPPGKLASQVAHAAMAFITHRLKTVHHYNRNYGEWQISTAERDWLDNSYAKVVLGVDSEEELEAICRKAESGYEVHRIVDDGRTVFNGVPTFTCAAIGPNYNFLIDQITGHLRLY